MAVDPRLKDADSEDFDYATKTFAAKYTLSDLYTYVLYAIALSFIGGIFQHVLWAITAFSILTGIYARWCYYNHKASFTKIADKLQEEIQAEIQVDNL
jgi:hypothetical protein